MGYRYTSREEAAIDRVKAVANEARWSVWNAGDRRWVFRSPEGRRFRWDAKRGVLEWAERVRLDGFWYRKSCRVPLPRGVVGAWAVARDQDRDPVL